MIALIPRRDAEALRLRPALEAWERVEAEHGALGQLYLELKCLRFRLATVSRVLFECARAAGEEVTFAAVQRAVADHGLLASADLAVQLLDDLFKPAPSESEAEEGAGEQVPLATGESEASSAA